MPEVSTDNSQSGKLPRSAVLVATPSNPGFRSWFVAHVFAASGATTLSIGQSWLIVQITHSGLALSGMTVVLFGPVLLGGAVAGTLLDRIDRRRALLGTRVAYTVISVGLAVAATTGTATLWLLYLTALLTGSVNALDWPARQVHIAELAGPGRAGAAVGMYEVALMAARVVGPAVAGVFLASWGPVPCFAFTATSYLPGIAVLLRSLRRAGPSRQERAWTREHGAALAGLQYVCRHSEIRAALFVAAAVGMLFNLSVTLPLLATKTFHLGGGGYGALNAAFGGGGLVGALTTAHYAANPTGRLVRVLAVATGAAILLTAAAPTVPLLVAAIAVTGFVSIWLLTQANTLVQLRSDPGLRGRVMGVWNMASPGMNPVTAPAIGAVGDAVGPREAFGLAGVCVLAAVGLNWTALRDQGPTTTPDI